MNTTRSPTKGKVLVFCGGCLLAAGIGAVQYLASPEMTLSLFYLLPIMLTAWYVGLWAGVAVAFCCTGFWLLADLTVIDAFSRHFIPIVNESFRLLVFLIIAWITATLHKALSDFLSPPDSVGEMIAAADKLMYVAKKDQQLNIFHQIIGDTSTPAGEDRSGPFDG
jgi:hypothetical protein